MAEYIDREEYCEKHCRCSNEYCDKESCPIWKAPAADVVQVLRCKDCKDWGPGTGDVPICGETYEPMPPDGFCSIGERKPSADG